MRDIRRFFGFGGVAVIWRRRFRRSEVWPSGCTRTIAENLRTSRMFCAHGVVLLRQACLLGRVRLPLGVASSVSREIDLQRAFLRGAIPRCIAEITPGDIVTGQPYAGVHEVKAHFVRASMQNTEGMPPEPEKSYVLTNGGWGLLSV